MDQQADKDKTDTMATMSVVCELASQRLELLGHVPLAH